MPTLYEQRNMHFPPHIWAALDALAAATNSIAKRGPKARQPSLLVMLERIATNEIEIRERVPYKLPDGLATAADRIERAQRAPEEQERVIKRARHKLDEHEQTQRKLKRSQLDGDAPQKPRSKLAQLNMFPEPA